MLNMQGRICLHLESAVWKWNKYGNQKVLCLRENTFVKERSWSHEKAYRQKDATVLLPPLFSGVP